MNLADFLAPQPIACILGWLVIAGVILWGNHRWHRLSQRADVTRRAAYPPPPPKPRPREDFTALLAEQPTEVWLTDELCDRLFDDLIAIEGLDR